MSVVTATGLSRPEWLALRPLTGNTVSGFALVLPAVVFLGVFFVWPVLQMIVLSVSQQRVEGAVVVGFTIDNYLRLFSNDLYFRVLLRTLRLAAAASVIGAVLAYPLAIAIARGGPGLARLVTITLIAPLLVNVVVRSFGWSAILNNSGALAYLLRVAGLSSTPPAVLYTEWAVLIACVHIYLPFVVMPIATAISRIDLAVEEAARVAGASRFATFRRITFPLSLPGLAVGASLMFSLTAAAYVMPQILGGNFSPLLGTLIEQQVLTLSDWPFGAAIATLLIAVVLTVNLLFIGLLSRRFSRWAGGSR